MSDLDTKTAPAEARLAGYSRDALARARSSGRLGRLIDATIASAAPIAASTTAVPRVQATAVRSWPMAAGAAAIAGAVTLAWFTTRDVTVDQPAPPPPVSASASAAPAPARESAPRTTEVADTSPTVDVAALPDVVEATKPSASSKPSLAAPFGPADAPMAAPEQAAPEEVHEEASALFERGNTARRRGDSEQAEKLYLRLVAVHPTSREATTSRIILGRMQLARGAASEALTSFDGYLAAAPHGALEEQALIGRAQSLQSLGRRDEERAAWRALLEAFPSTTSRQTALERIGAP